VGRWTGGCACTPRQPEWKTRLRAAFDTLAAHIDRIYLDETHSLFRDPWRLRNRYIHVLLGEITLMQLLSEETDKTLTNEAIRRVGLLLEAQRERQRMFTSCGWFFDDFDRIEPKNNVIYAAHAANLVEQATGIDLSRECDQDLCQVISPRTGLKASQLFELALARG
jgi:hypothetical protein